MLGVSWKSFFADCPEIRPFNGIRSILSGPLPPITVSESFLVLSSLSCVVRAPFTTKSPINEIDNIMQQRKKNTASEVEIQKPTLLFFLLSTIMLFPILLIMCELDKLYRYYANVILCLWIL